MTMSTNNTIPGLQAFTAAARSVIENPVFTGARFGFDVRDAVTGSPIFQHNSYDIFHGASTTKISTCVYALALLGPDFRFRTKLVRSGQVDELSWSQSKRRVIAAITVRLLRILPVKAGANQFSGRRC